LILHEATELNLTADSGDYELQMLDASGVNVGDPITFSVAEAETEPEPALEVTEAPTEAPTAPPTEAPTAPMTEALTQPPTEPPAEAPPAEPVAIELHKATIGLNELADSSTSIPSYTIYNKSEADVLTGQEYALERYGGTSWTQVSLDFSEREWQDMEYTIPASGMLDFTMSIWPLLEEIIPGEYRLVKMAGVEGKPESALDANFTVTE
jgi:hypothetical protein